MNDAGDDRFENYRQFYSHAYSKYLKDGEVVLKAAEWAEFRDPELKVLLQPIDLENLGVLKTQTRQEIIQCLSKTLENKTVPPTSNFSQKYREALEIRQKIETQEQELGKLIYLPSAMLLEGEKIKEELAKAFHRAIKQVIDFCEESNESKKPEAKPEPKPESPSDRVMEWIIKWLW